MIDQIIRKSSELYTPEMELCIDESMIRYHGKSSMTVYVKNKPIQWGFRAFVLCESCSGFVLNWFLDRSSQIVIFFFFIGNFIKMDAEEIKH